MVGVLLCVFGLLALRLPFIIFGLLLQLLIAAVHSERQELALDLPQRRYRRFASFFGFKHGSWQPLPDITGVVVKYFSEYEVAGRRQWQIESAQASYVLLLSVRNSEQGIVVQKFVYQQKAEALVLAGSIARYLGVDTILYDGK